MKPLDNYVARNAELIGECLDGFSGIVFADNIVSVDFSSGCSHVYNLQTENGYYFVNSSIAQSKRKNNGIFAIAHNCRCTLTYKVVGFGASEDAKNIEGELITYSDKLDGEKWNESKSIINGLTEEYNTKLQEVRPGSHQSAGSVQISGTVMNLSSAAPEVAFHEFAHTISIENQTKFGLYDEADFWKEIKRVQRQYRKEVGDDASRWISAYEHGSRSTDEFMAEAFAQAKMSEMGFDLPGKYGKDLTYSMRVLEIIDKYFKRK